MKLTIQKSNGYKEYEVESQEESTLLEILMFIQERIDPELSFRFGCRSGICGCCALRLDGKEVLACTHKPNTKEATVEPLRFHDVIKDLAVAYEVPLETLERAKAYMQEPAEDTPNSDDLALFEKQSDCILCGSCYSACPVFAVDKEFLGPFTLTRAFRYIIDVKEVNKLDKISAIQYKGVWDCTSCGECSAVCPQGIDPKADIIKLRIQSAAYGFSDPNIQNFSVEGYGFNPF